MPKHFKDTEYFGFGDMESLADFSEHTLLGLYRTKVGEFEEPHIKPQESGSRRGTRYARVTSSKTGAGLLIEADGTPLYFKASKNFTEDFARAKHREDLPVRDVTAVSLDGYLRAAGSNSCGPEPFSPHNKLLGQNPIGFGFRITPIRSDE
jgi:beta-galactosidase